LAGQTPFGRRSPAELLAAHVTERPRPITEIRADLPAPLAALVMRCLEKKPAHRPRSAAEIVHELDEITTPSAGTAPTAALPTTPPESESTVARQSSGVRRHPIPRVVVVGLLAAILGVAGVVLWKRGAATSPASGPAAAMDVRDRRIAVLPFENLGDSADAYFADGITDAVRGKLTALPGMRVIASTSSAQYRNTTKTPQEIGRELGVDYLLVGKVRWAKGKDGSRVQVSPELIEVATASAKWQQPFDADLTDVFKVQADVA